MSAGIPSFAEAWQAVSEDYAGRPQAATACVLGDPLIVHPAGAELTAPAFYILGFNGGETAQNADDRPTRSACRWFDLCARASAAVGAEAWGITERCHWGSPDIPTLIRRLGSRDRLRDLLRLHARANRAMFDEIAPLLVWVTGLGYMAEAIEDYGLEPVGEPQMREVPLKGVLWREFRSSDRTPYLFTRHPTGARFARGEHDLIFSKLAQLAQARPHREGGHSRTGRR